MGPQESQVFPNVESALLRPACWAEILGSYDFIIQHLDGEKDPADRTSRRPDCEEVYKRHTAQLLASQAATTIDPFNDLLPPIKAAQDMDPLATDRKHIIGYPDLPETSVQDRSTDKKADMKWTVIAGALTFDGRIYVPETLPKQVISLFHDNPESGHFEGLKPAELISRAFYWLGLVTKVRRYVAGHDVCHRIKGPHHARYGANMQLPPPFNAWAGISMEFVTNLPESTKSEYIGILVIVDGLTKLAISRPCRKESYSPELAHMFFGLVICKHGIPKNIVPGHATRFSSRFCTRVCSHMIIDNRLSSGFYLRTIGQTERPNQTMQRYL